jgi:hypothetical protein
MHVLAMLELEGDTEPLLAAAADLARRVGEPDGLLLRIVAPTEDGMVLFQLWDSPAARQANADDPGHSEALLACGVLELMRSSRARAFEGATLELFTRTA